MPAIAAVAVVASSAGHGQEGASIVGNWVIVKKDDPITDEKTIMAFSKGNTAEALLQVRCQAKTAYLTVSFNGIKLTRGDMLTGTIRIDGGKPREDRYLTFTATAAAAPLTMDVYKQISHAKKVGFRLARDDGDTWSILFNLDQTAEALKPILAACPIDKSKQD